VQYIYLIRSSVLSSSLFWRWRNRRRKKKNKKKTWAKKSFCPLSTPFIWLGGSYAGGIDSRIICLMWFSPPIVDVDSLPLDVGFLFSFVGSYTTNFCYKRTCRPERERERWVPACRRLSGNVVSLSYAQLRLSGDISEHPGNLTCRNRPIHQSLARAPSRRITRSHASIAIYIYGTDG